MTRAIIGATGAVCSIGGTSEQIWTSHRAGISRIANSHVLDKHFDAIQMGLVPEDQLPPLLPELETIGLPARARRMLRLAAAPFAHVAAGIKAPVRVFLGMPELNAAESPWLENFLPLLAQSSQVEIDLEQSAIVPRGRAAALRALEAAQQSLEDAPNVPVIVGGVDTYLDLNLLAKLDAEGRILGPQVMDGFIPGEGAAFFVLHSPADASAKRNANLIGVASIKDEGSRYGNAPAKGEGLAHAIQKIRDSSPSAPVATTFAGFNGENFDAKLWGVAQLRHTDFFAPDMFMEHPADKYGDAGAATGALLTVMAVTAMSKGHRPGPSLVWAASDSELRACALLSQA